MNRRTAYLACAGAVVALAAPAVATAAPVDVNVRIEGRTQTLFDGQVRTDGKTLTTASGGTHRCDGTNGGAGTPAGGTPTTALDDAALAGGFSWDGTFDTNYDDYFITRVGQDPQTSSEYWGDYVNDTLASVGGCHDALRPGDSVLWAFDAFGKDGLLRASAPAVATVNQPFQVRVTDFDGAPQPGATVGSATSDANGVATLAYPAAGDYRVKAEKTRYVRSRAVAVRVQDPAVRDVTAPVLSGVSASSSAFRVDKRASASVARGTGFRFSLSEPATVVFRTEQRIRGKWRTIRVFGRRYVTGPQVLPFSGRIKPRGKTRTLKPGRYRLALRPSDPGGNRGALTRVGFAVVR